MSTSGVIAGIALVATAAIAGGSTASVPASGARCTLNPFYSALPTRTEHQTRAPEALDRLRAWEAAIPDLAVRYPATAILSDAKRRFEPGR